MSRYKAIWFVAPFLLILSNLTFGATRSVQQIEIKSYWGGLGTPQNTELLIRKEDGIYRFGGKQVNATLVQSLGAAVQQPVVSAPSLQNLGLTKDWLASTAEKAAQNGYGMGTKEQNALFRTSYTNPEFVAKVLPSLFVCCHTDDYPGVKVTLTYNDGSVIALSSHSQSDFMLPWKIEANGGSTETFNKDISLALVALMPKRATNRGRLAGDGLGLELADAMMNRIKDDWNLLGAESKDSAALAQISTVYKVIKADVNPYHDVVFGIDWEGHKPPEENLHVEVTRQMFPPGFTETAILLYQNGKVSGVDEFLRNAGRYEDLVLSVPWLSRLRTWGMTLMWVHDKSMSDKAMKNFAADMHALGKDELAEEVRRDQDKVAVLNVSYGDFWLVLPDRRMVLWRFESVRGLLGLNRSEIPTVECTDYQGVTGGCAGVTISPEGEFEKAIADW